MKSLTLNCIFAVGLSLFAAVCNAEGIAVITHPGVGLPSLTKEDVARIFMAKSKQFPNEKSAIPINQKPDSPIRAAFEEKILGKSSPQMKAYWSQLVFTGRAVPPAEFASDEETKKAVAKNPAMVGYIDPANVDGSVKVVLFVQ